MSSERTIDGFDHYLSAWRTGHLSGWPFRVERYSLWSYAVHIQCA